MTTETPTLDQKINDLVADLPKLRGLPTTVKDLEEEQDRLGRQVTELRRSSLANSLVTRHSSPGTRPIGRVSDECARALAARFILHCERSGALDALCSIDAQRNTLLNVARDILNINVVA